jgi:glycosyltransferase involved in cell wall biosynthesis
MSRLSVVSPLYRTSDHVAEFIERVGAILDTIGLDWEIIAVDDHCPEHTGERVRDLAGGVKPRVYRLDRNVGQHAATAVGIRMSKGDLVAVLDADLQDPPEALPSLLGEMDEDVDVVVATRRGRHEGPGRRVTGYLFRTLRWALSRGRVPRGAGMFLVARRSVLERVSGLEDPGIHLISGLARVGARFRAVPVVRQPRASGESAFSSTMRVQLAFDALVAITSAQPWASSRRASGWTEPEIELITAPTVHGGSAS